MTEILKFEGENRLTLNSLCTAVGVLIEDYDKKRVCAKVMNSLKSVHVLNAIVDVIRIQEKEEKNNGEKNNGKNLH